MKHLRFVGWFLAVVGLVVMVDSCGSAKKGKGRRDAPLWAPQAPTGGTPNNPGSSGGVQSPGGNAPQDPRAADEASQRTAAELFSACTGVDLADIAMGAEFPAEAATGICDKFSLIGFKDGVSDSKSPVEI